MLDDAVEEKDGGEKVRLGMVVRYLSLRAFCIMNWKEFGANVYIGHSRQFRRYA